MGGDSTVAGAWKLPSSQLQMRSVVHIKRVHQHMRTCAKFTFHTLWSEWVADCEWVSVHRDAVSFSLSWLSARRFLFYFVGIMN